MYERVSAILTDESGKVVGAVSDDGMGRAFRRGWQLLVDKMSVENPPALTLSLSTEVHLRLEFDKHTRMSALGDQAFQATVLNRAEEVKKCLCGVCGWDEAKRVSSRLAVSDPFRFRCLEPDIESLVTDDDEGVTFYAPHPQVRVECDMCAALREKGINPITMKPEGT